MAGRRTDGIWVDGKFYDWAHAPAWVEDVLPALGTYDEDGNLHLHPKTLSEAEENEARNNRGSARVGAIIVAIGVTWLILLTVLLGLAYAKFG